MNENQSEPSDVVPLNRSIIWEINDHLRDLARRHPTRTLYVGYIPSGEFDDEGNEVYQRFFGYRARMVIRAVNDLICGLWSREVVDPSVPVVEVCIRGLEPQQDAAQMFGDEEDDRLASAITKATARAFAGYGIGDEGYLDCLWVPENDDLSKAVWLDLSDESETDVPEPAPAIYGRPERPLPSADELAGEPGQRPEWDMSTPETIAQSVYDSFKGPARQLLELDDADRPPSERISGSPEERAVLPGLTRIVMTSWVLNAARQMGYTSVPQTAPNPERTSSEATEIGERRLKFSSPRIVNLTDWARQDPEAITRLCAARRAFLASEATS